jgi:hypothetical protein
MKIEKLFNKFLIIYSLILLIILIRIHLNINPVKIKNNKSIINCNKWIVLTTINEPTESVKYLRDSTFDWCFLSIGDLKTNKNWNYKDIYFIDTNKQNDLVNVFKLIKQIPFNSYARKIIGYLLAIKYKAKYIYETDDNSTRVEDGLFNFKYEYFSGLEQSFNHTNLYSISTQMPIIQYSRFSFDLNSPILILKNNNQYLNSYYSDSTFYHYDSFWSLIFPISCNKSMQSTRSLITIRLLDEINARFAYFPSSSVKTTKNNYNLKLITSLNKWKCNETKFELCFINLISNLVSETLLDQIEIKNYKYWINALNHLNYKWPSLVVNKPINNLHKEKIYYNPLLLVKKQENIILITKAFDLNELNEISLFQKVYFSYIIVCYNNDNISNNNNNQLTIIYKNKTFQECVQTAFKIGFKQQTYLIAEKFQYWNFISLKEANSINNPKNVYLTRRNVANGIRLLNYDKINKHRQFNMKTLENLISNLNWHQNDLASEFCQNLKVKTIWIPDFHDGPRVDISSTLLHLGQTPILAGYKYNHSPYPHAISLIKYMQNISNLMFNNDLRQDGISEQEIKENFNFYKNNKYFHQVDAIICSFPSSLCECFMPLNQTLIFNPAHRYNLMRYSNKKWRKLNDNYEILNRKQKLILAGMSKYDWEYQFHYTGMKQFRLFAYGGFYAKNIKYNPKRLEILIGPTNHLGRFGLEMLEQLDKIAAINRSQFKFKAIRSIYSNYTLEDLAQHKAIVLFPYGILYYIYLFTILVIHT